MEGHIESEEREKPKTKICPPARISFRFNGEIKTFTEKQKLREISTTKPALNKFQRNFSRQETQEKKRTYKNKPPNN